MGLSWFAVQTNPQCERRAFTGLKERGFTAFLPVATRWKRSRSKARERVDTPLFTGYLFVGLAPGQSLYDVRLQDGVRGVVCGTDGEPVNVGQVPVLLPSGKYLRDADGKLARYNFVYDLQSRQAAGEFDHTPARKSPYAKGRKARVLNGPFKDQIGEMLAADDKGRVQLMLEGLFSGKMWVDDDHLEPADDLPKAA